MTQPLVTILVPMLNEEDFIESCLQSLCTQDYPADRMEILVLDGRSTDRSPEIVRALTAHDPRLRLLDNPGRIQAIGMNLGMHAAQGEILVRADAHAIYGPTYISTCVAHLLAGRAENVGGVQRAAGATPFTAALAAAMNSPLGAGNAAYRVATEPVYADTAWLGAWHRATLLDLGGFREDMAANEDYELNCRLRKAGGRILVDPALPVAYYPRSSFPRLWRQYFRYGMSKIRTLQLHPDSLLPRQLLPPVFTLGLVLSLLLIPLSPIPALVFAIPYLLAVVLASCITARKAGWQSLPYLVLIFPVMHLAWGLGFLYGLLCGGVPKR